MALKKDFPMNDPDNGVIGNYVKCVGIQLPQFDMSFGWTTGRLLFGIWLNKEARAAGAISLRLLTVEVPAAFFDELRIVPDIEVTLGAVYDRKAMIPILADAEDI